MRIFELNQLKYKFFFLFLERNNFENSINGILELFYLKEYDYDTFLLAEQGNKSIEDGITFLKSIFCRFLKIFKSIQENLYLHYTRLKIQQT